MVHPSSTRPPPAAASRKNARDRFARVRVLIADRDPRTARLVARLLFSFGIRGIEIAPSGQAALDLLGDHPYDFVITEWEMEPVNGIDLVRAIRFTQGGHQPRRDIPIIMLTARTEQLNVETARDAGITEFVAKPFSAATISGRIAQLIDNPRAFVDNSPEYIGPCRRRRGVPPAGKAERRHPRSAPGVEQAPDYALRRQLGIDSAGQLFHAEAVAAAQAELMESLDDYLDWAKLEIAQLKMAYSALTRSPADEKAQQSLSSAAYAIQSQAGIFGYQLGTDVAKLLVDYVSIHLPPGENQLIVIGKHIEAVAATFNRNPDQQSLARDLMQSLSKLVEKLT